MKSSWWYRFSFLLVVVITSLVMIIPTVFDFQEDTSYPVKGKINLGLDLQGGLYMILGIDFNKVYKDEIKNFMKRFEFTLQDNGIASTPGELVTSDPADPKHSIVISNKDQVEKAKEVIKRLYPTYVRLTNEGGSVLEYGINLSYKSEIESQSVNKSIEVIRNRIDEFGVTEPEIVSQGTDRIVVQLPGVKDINRAKQLIGKTARLEFRLVNDNVAQAKIQGWVKEAEEAGIVFEKGQRFSDYLDKLNEHVKLPVGHQLAFQKVTNKVTNEVVQLTPYLVESTAGITGEDLQDAGVAIDPQKNLPYVSLNFKSGGAKRFEEITAKNKGRRLAVILDGNVYTDPVINERISGGRAKITLGQGNYSSLIKQARDIALVLRAGALPVQLDFEEQRIVGPSLGHDSIEKAKTASMVGGCLVMIFVLIYYRIGGFLALSVLSINVLIVLAILVGLEATLTLPGIAGIALTIGMAVDATIIIYERIREEILKGANYFKAVETGFQHAFWTILDANITTALAGLCLLNFGTGPIRGFAVTLLIGIVATVYTSYFVGKLLFELYVHSMSGKDLSI